MTFHASYSIRDGILESRRGFLDRCGGGRGLALVGRALAGSRRLGQAKGVLPKQ